MSEHEPARSWQSALRQLASNWMDPYEEYGSPDSPEEGCATILAAAIAGEMHAEDRVRDGWVDALHQLASTLAPGANIEIDPADPEASCARIVEAVGRRIARLEGRIEYNRQAVHQLVHGPIDRRRNGP